MTTILLMKGAHMECKRRASKNNNSFNELEGKAPFECRLLEYKDYNALNGREQGAGLVCIVSAPLFN